MCSEQLELVEDKLRDFRTLSDDDGDDKTVALSQLDSLRRELISCAKDRLPLVVFAKELVREVVAFADMGATSEAGPSAPGSAEQPRHPLSPLQQPADGSVAPNGSSPGASPTPPKSRRDARLYRSYGENDPSLPSAVTTPPGRRSHVSQSLDFSRALQRFRRLRDPVLQDPCPGFGEAPWHNAAETSTRGVRTGLALAPLRGPYHAGASRRSGLWETGVSTMDEADKIIFGSSMSDKLRSANRQQSPMLSPGRVRDAELYQSTNGSSRYNFDPEFGGKVSLQRLRGDEPQPAPLLERSRGRGQRGTRSLLSDGRLEQGTARSDDASSSVSTRGWTASQPAATPLAVRRLPGPSTPAGLPKAAPTRSGLRVGQLLGKAAKLLLIGTAAAVAAVVVTQGVEWYACEEQQLRRQQGREAREVRRQRRSILIVEKREQRRLRQAEKRQLERLRREQLRDAALAQAAQEQAAQARAEAAAEEHQRQQVVREERAQAEAEERQRHQALQQQQAWAEAEECRRQESLQEQRARAEAEELRRQKALREEKARAKRLRRQQQQAEQEVQTRRLQAHKDAQLAATARAQEQARLLEEQQAQQAALQRLQQEAAAAAARQHADKQAAAAAAAAARFTEHHRTQAAQAAQAAALRLQQQQDEQDQLQRLRGKRTWEQQQAQQWWRRLTAVGPPEALLQDATPSSIAQGQPVVDAAPLPVGSRPRLPPPSIVKGRK
eukprot:jgi/Astpho2/5510/Aster-x1296